MARLARVEVFSPDEVAIVHVINRTVRRCFLMGNDPLTGKNYDHRKSWMEDQLRHLAAHFGIDLLCYAILSNHFQRVPTHSGSFPIRWFMNGRVLSTAQYLELLDWTERRMGDDKRGYLVPPIYYCS